MRRRLMAGMLALGLLAGAASAAGPVLPIIEVRFVNAGPGPLDEDFVRSQILTRAGVDMDRTQLNRDVKSLLDTRRFSDIAVDIESASNGVAVVFSIRNRLKLVKPVEVVGASTLSESRVRDTLGLLPGDRVDEAVVGVAVQKLLAKYREELYPEAKAVGTVVETDRAEGLGAVKVEIEEGRKAHIARFEFPGADALPYSDLRSMMNHPAWYNPIGWFSGHKYDPDELESGRLQIRDALLDKGLLDARVEAPVLEYSDSAKVTATVNVREGRRYTVGRITLEGVSQFPEAELWEQMKIRTGELASHRQIMASSDAVQGYYTSRGFMDTLVRPTLKPAGEAGVVDLHYRVMEGKLAKIRNVIVQGNTQTKDKVIRREIQVYPGEVYNEAAVKRSERRLMNLGYFSTARSHPLDTPLAGTKDVAFEVEEQRTGNLAMGFGFSSIDNLMGYVEVSQGNFDIAGWPFRGGGQKLKVGAQVSETRQRYNVSFVEPWFMDRELRLGVDLYHSLVEYDEYDTRRTGTAVDLSRSLPWNSRVGLEYRLERVSLDDLSDTNTYVDIDTGEAYVEEEYDRLDSSLTLSLTYDSRNRAFFPTSGARARLAGTLTGGILGFDTEMYALRFSASRYLSPGFDHVLSARLQCEVVDFYGRTDEVPITERLFLGGPYTLRGFDYRDVGPKVRYAEAPPGDDWHKPIGGCSLAMANLEYTIPLVKPLRMAAFYDIGNVWADPYEFDLDELASSWGLGIRFDIPGFPMRFDYAWVLEVDDEYTDKRRFSFTLGYGF